MKLNVIDELGIFVEWKIIEFVRITFNSAMNSMCYVPPGSFFLRFRWFHVILLKDPLRLIFGRVNQKLSRIKTKAPQLLFAWGVCAQVFGISKILLFKHSMLTHTHTVAAYFYYRDKRSRLESWWTAKNVFVSLKLRQLNPFVCFSIESNA